MDSRWTQRTRTCVLGGVCLVGLALAAGCSGGDSDNGSSGPSHDYSALTLEEACSAACQAQERTNCRGVYPAGQCTELCIGIPESFPGCEDAWRNINGCMAEAPLFCDQVNGGAAVSADDCGPEIDAFAACP